MKMVCDPEQACAVHLQPRLAEFLNLAAKQLVGIWYIEVSCRFVMSKFLLLGKLTYTQLGIFTC